MSTAAALLPLSHQKFGDFVGAESEWPITDAKVFMIKTLKT